MSARQPVLAAVMTAVAFLAGSVASATPLSFTTVFGPGAPGSPGDLAPGVGSFPSAGVLGAIANFTDFSVQNLDDMEPTGNPIGATSNTGQILFFQSGGPTGFYVGGLAGSPAFGNDLTPQGLANLGGPVANNRAYGVFGEGRSDFTFAPSAMVTTLDLQVRGTNANSSIGPAMIGQSLPPGTPLADALGTVLVYTNLGLQVTSSPVNIADFSTLSVDINSIPGDFITRVSLINQGPVNSAIVLGELTVGTQNVTPNGIPVPEPTSLALIGLVAGVTTLGRRR